MTHCLLKFRIKYLCFHMGGDIITICECLPTQMPYGMTTYEWKKKESLYLGSHGHLHGISQLFYTLKHQRTSFHSKSDILGCIVSVPTKPTSNLYQNIKAQLSHHTKTRNIGTFSKMGYWFQQQLMLMGKQRFLYDATIPQFGRHQNAFLDEQASRWNYISIYGRKKDKISLD